jgi:hypothetical protein
MMQTTCVEARGTADDAMNLIAFGQEEFSAVKNRGGLEYETKMDRRMILQIRPVLSCDTWRRKGLNRETI